MELAVSISVVSLFIIAALSGLAVFLHCIDDTFGQRVALAGICYGAFGLLWLVLQSNDSPGPVTLLCVSGALYAITTFLRSCK